MGRTVRMVVKYLDPEQSIIMSNNYMNIGFRLELESKYWSDVYLLRIFVSDNLVRLAFSPTAN